MPVTDRTLHFAHYTLYGTLRSEPEAVTDPESAPVHFILHIEHCKVHTTHLYCTLHTYHFTLHTVESWLSSNSSWWRQMYLNISCL